jgi:mono/diheme cytochrome c family protein
MNDRFPVAACVATVLVVGGGGTDLSAATAEGGDGAALYREHCASCHGKDGGGDGVLANDLRFKPRAFKEGRFAFGNTADAMAKTVMSGIPGQDMARMPAFKSVLSETEIDAVVTYVRTLMAHRKNDCEFSRSGMGWGPEERLGIEGAGESAAWNRGLGGAEGGRPTRGSCWIAVAPRVRHSRTSRTSEAGVG